MRPMGAAGVCLEHRDKWFASIRSAADCRNAVKPGAIKPAAGTPPPRSGFQALPQWRPAAAAAAARPIN